MWSEKGKKTKVDQQKDCCFDKEVKETFDCYSDKQHESEAKCIKFHMHMEELRVIANNIFCENVTGVFEKRYLVVGRRLPIVTTKPASLRLATVACKGS